MTILQALYFALPMYFANMAPVIVSRLPLLDTPIDGGRFWRGKPILGPHKTWRGLLAGIFFGVATVYVQRLIGAGPFLDLVNYADASIWQLGVLMGAGAMIGDAVKSFFKRRIGKVSGATWPPFDQLDFVVGGLLAASVYAHIPWSIAAWIILLTPLGHLLVNRLAFAAGWKSVPY